MLRAVIFDFDGVIADTERLHLRAFQDVLASEGMALTAEDYARRYLGMADGAVFEAVAHDRGLALDATRLATLLGRKAVRYQELVAAGEVLIPGVAARVREWTAELPVAVASGARRSEIEGVLSAAGLMSCFTAIVAAEDVARSKPAPDAYLEALHRLNAAVDREPKTAGAARRPIKPGEVAAIEDSLAGIASVTAAGMHAVAVTTNYPARAFTGAELVVASVAELDLPALGRLVSPA